MKLPVYCPRLQEWLPLLCLSLSLLLTAPVSADSSTWCRNIGSSLFTIPPIIMTPQQGSGDFLVYDSGEQFFQYQCYLDPKDSNENQYTKLSIAHYDELRHQLEQAGLAMFIAFPPYDTTHTYNVLNGFPDFAGLDRIRPGVLMTASFPFKLVIKKKGTFNGAVKTIFQQKPVVFTVKIDTLPGSTTSVSYGFNSFRLQIIPQCFGSVEITPNPVNLGHVYTFQSQVQKQIPFTITARRAPGCGEANDLYDYFDLLARFDTTADMDSNQTILLKDKQGTLNGLRLSIQDESHNTPILFNQPLTSPSVFGQLRKSAGKVSVNYTARLTGQPLVTGEFSADVVVLITYQ